MLEMDDVTGNSQCTTRSARTVKKLKRLVEEDSPNRQCFKGVGSCEKSHAHNTAQETSSNSLGKSVKQRAI